MKKIAFTVLALFTLSICVYAQNNATEARMAYQLAEEEFEAKEYTKALEYLERAEKALGKTNPPMAYLKVMINDELAKATQKEADGGKHLENLERAIADFENIEGKEALGNDKLMQVYRININVEKRKKEFAAFFDQFEKEQKLINKANDILKDLPRIGESANILKESRFSNKFNQNSLDKLFQNGQRWLSFPIKTLEVGDSGIEYIGLADNKIDYYMFWRNVGIQQQKNKSRKISKNELIDYFGLQSFEEFVFLNTKGNYIFSYKEGNVDFLFSFIPDLRVIKNNQGQYSSFIVVNVYSTQY